MIYTNKDILDSYDKNLLDAQNGLKLLKFRATINTPSFAALGGWVFEETICNCLSKELKSLSSTILDQLQISEQFKLSSFKTGSKGVTDFKISKGDKHILLEVKSSGIHATKNLDTYKVYLDIIKAQVGCEYLYINGYETSKHYKQKTQNIFGVDNAFFLDSDADAWEKFVQRVKDILI
ncbi:hypothetical protein K9O30_17750 [Clostridium bowmanii]|uniref:hypothetical protein n=1 Tax=Clostridium bowmanii TaxID=132925 RepID=UPI001C0E6244|nr:hypothetical protein [Clostridium bowmanii]MBU3191137.1 hypothetical protein [Clostridium bowmanii]MCA1075528.1 hypothetical protein [Clostridium bowmanii]